MLIYSRIESVSANLSGITRLVVTGTGPLSPVQSCQIAAETYAFYSILHSNFVSIEIRLSEITSIHNDCTGSTHLLIIQYLSFLVTVSFMCDSDQIDYTIDFILMVKFI